jgi:phage-related tail protein
MKLLMALSINPGNRDSAAKTFTGLRAKPAKEKAAWEKDEAEVETLAWAVKYLKDSADKFAAQIPRLEEKVKHLENKVIDMLNNAHAKELSL